MKQVSLWDDKTIAEDNKEYLVLAGISKYERQLYLGTYKDCSDWYISIVPCKVNYRKAQKIIKKATNDLSKRTERFGKAVVIPEFELKEVNS